MEEILLPEVQKPFQWTIHTAHLHPDILHSKTPKHYTHQQG